MSTDEDSDPRHEDITNGEYWKVLDLIAFVRWLHDTQGFDFVRRDTKETADGEEMARQVYRHVLHPE